MREVFAKRRLDFRNQCVKYLRYVLNDHFVLFLMVFLGFTAASHSLPFTGLGFYGQDCYLS